MNLLINGGFLLFAWWLIRRDTRMRPGVSGATWIPTLWVGILASRPVSAWLGMGGGDTLEGSPLDRLFFFGMIAASLYVLSKRSVNWGAFLAKNWALVLFYGFLLLSVVWANSPVSSLKRWTKEVGNVFVVLVILTEASPLQALRAVFVRCAYLLIPLSFIFIRWFPSLGRQYNIHNGSMEATGVTFQKNSLGSMILVTGVILFWDWLERRKDDSVSHTALDRYFPFALFGIGGWLIWLSDSKTSMMCLGLALAIVAAARLPGLHRRISSLGMLVLFGGGLFFLADQWWGVTQWLVSNLGRDMTFTGRTDVWRELLNVGVDPILGTGFMSLWDDPHYRALLPEWVACSAHNGYLEIYLAGGVFGAAALGVLILATGARINSALRQNEQYAVVRFAVFVAAVIANFTESNFACMTPLGFLFLIASIGEAPQLTVAAPADAEEEPAPVASTYSPEQAEPRLEPQA